MTGQHAPRAAGRLVAAILTMFAPFASVIYSFLIWKDQLPPELASHWSDTGQADGTMTVAQYLGVTLTLTGTAAVASVVVGMWPGMRPYTRRIGFLIAGAIAGAGAQSWLVSAYLTMQVGDPYEVIQGIWSVLGFAAIGYGLIPFFIAPKPQFITQDTHDRIELVPNEAAAWSCTVTAPLFLWTALALTILGASGYAAAAAFGETDGAVFGFISVAVAIAILISLSRYRVTVDWRGLRVESYLFRVPVKRIRLQEISAVEAVEITPRDWGGWGYRVMPGQSALIVRKGPGLKITLSNANQFAITVDHPETLAALVATLRDQPGETR